MESGTVLPPFKFELHLGNSAKLLNLRFDSDWPAALRHGISKIYKIISLNSIDMKKND